jgi:hypothetical protein
VLGTHHPPLPAGRRVAVRGAWRQTRRILACTPATMKKGRATARKCALWRFVRDNEGVPGHLRNQPLGRCYRRDGTLEDNLSETFNVVEIVRGRVEDGLVATNRLDGRDQGPDICSRDARVGRD